MKIKEIVKKYLEEQGTITKGVAKNYTGTKTTSASKKLKKKEKKNRKSLMYRRK
jgi:hypothetical protein